MSRAKRALAMVLNIIMTEAESDASKIMSRCGEAEVVDARWICVKLLNELGYYPSRIAELMGITPRYVQYILCDFEDRIVFNAVMRNNYERGRKRLRNISEVCD